MQYSIDSNQIYPICNCNDTYCYAGYAHDLQGIAV